MGKIYLPIRLFWENLMENYINENNLTICNVLSFINIATIIIELIALIIIVFACYDFARKVIIALLSGRLEISDKWKVCFNETPIQFCVYVIIYLLFFVIISFAALYMAYNRFTR